MQRRNDQEFSSVTEVADWYDAKYTEMGDGWFTPDTEIDAHLDSMGYPSDATSTTLIDLGAGAGHALAVSARRNGFCCGSEISKVGRTIGMKRIRKAGFLNGCVMIPDPMEHIPYDDCFFDFAMSLGSMEHVLSIPVALTEMHRILKHGGRFLIYAPNELWLHYDQPLETTATEDEWLEWLGAAGLVVEKTIRNNDNNSYIGRKE